MGEREDFYDREVAPVLMELAKKCEDAKISFIAMTEWEPGETGRTATIQGDAGFGLKMAHTAMQAHGNVDSLMIAIKRYATEHGHSSAVLHLLGVPTTPAMTSTDGTGARK